MCRRPGLQGRRAALVVLVLAVSLFLSGCNGKQNVKQDVVIWDAEHKPVFPPKAFSIFVSELESSGLAVVEGGVKDIHAGGAYIIAGPTKRFEESEVTQIEDFVKRGGKLIIMVHIPPSNLKPLLDTFGIEVSPEPLKEREVSAFPAYPHVLTEGVHKIVLYGCFRVSNPLFKTKTGVGVVGYKEYGEGEVLVIGDDALFIDEYIRSASNLDYARNIARWLGLRSV